MTRQDDLFHLSRALHNLTSNRRQRRLDGEMVIRGLTRRLGAEAVDRMKQELERTGRA